MKQRERNGTGENRAAIDALAAEIEESYGVISVTDRPLIERAKSLATAVDHDPANSQLQIQFGAALTQLRREVMEAGRDAYDTTIWRITAGCETHDRGAVHCAQHCAGSWSIGEVEDWTPPMRTGLDDEEYGRRSVIEWLVSKNMIRYAE